MDSQMIQQQIEQTTRAFMNDLEVLVRQAAIQGAIMALGGETLPVVSGPVPVLIDGRPTLSKKSGKKRDPKVLAALVAQVQVHIEQHPGHGIEKIARDMKRKTSELTLPIAKLLASKRISKKGEKRATRYYPSKK